MQEVPSGEIGDAKVYECFVVPTPGCLFASALRGVDKIEREEYRNWALCDLIREQAPYARVDDAFAGSKKLTDPRLIYAALCEITEGLAVRAKIEQWLETGRLISEPNQRAKAITAVGDAMLTRRTYLEVRRLGGEFEISSGRQRNVIKRILLMVSLAEKFVTAGERGYGVEVLERAVADLAGMLPGPARDAAWATIAKVRLTLGETDAATRAMGRIGGEPARVRAIASGTSEKARLSKSKYAQRITASIGDLCYRTSALTEVAQGWHQLCDLKGARDILAGRSVWCLKSAVHMWGRFPGRGLPLLTPRSASLKLPCGSWKKLAIMILVLGYFGVFRDNCATAVVRVKHLFWRRRLCMK